MAHHAIKRHSLLLGNVQQTKMLWYCWRSIEYLPLTLQVKRVSFLILCFFFLFCDLVCIVKIIVSYRIVGLMWSGYLWCAQSLYFAYLFARRPASPHQIVSTTSFVKRIYLHRIVFPSLAIFVCSHGSPRVGAVFSWALTTCVLEREKIWLELYWVGRILFPHVTLLLSVDLPWIFIFLNCWC
jgi:hypothetical protein